MSNALQEGLIRIRLDTKERFSGEIAGSIIASMSRQIRANPEIPNDTKVVLIETGEGTWWAQIMLITGTGLAFVGGSVLAAQALMKDIRDGKTPFSRACAVALDEGEGDSVTLCAKDEEFIITKQEMHSYPPPFNVDLSVWIGPPLASTEDIERASQLEDALQTIGNANQPDVKAETLNSGEILAVVQNSHDSKKMKEGPTETPMDRRWFHLKELEKKDSTLLAPQIDVKRFNDRPAGRNMEIKGLFDIDHIGPKIVRSDKPVYLDGLQLALPIEKGTLLIVSGVEALGSTRAGKTAIYPSKISVLKPQE